MTRTQHIPREHDDQRRESQQRHSSPNGRYISPHILHIIHQFADESKQYLQENVVAEYLFGSYAKHTHTPFSDIDILVLVKHFTPEIQRELSGLASDYSLEYDVYISPIVKTLEVWEKNRYYRTLFYQEVTQ